ncbi:MAG: hypothetical protein KDJ67_15130 [Nitratireductor sp.]|nr:hypothetical protein [Nitratireductor sp.]
MEQNTEPDHTPQAAEQTSEPNRPADTLRDGSLKATIWQNENENGVNYSTTLARTWQGEDGTFRDSHSFSGSELLRIAELARGAYSRTNELRQEQHLSQKEEQQQARDEKDAPSKDEKDKEQEKDEVKSADRASFKASRAYRPRRSQQNIQR